MASEVQQRNRAAVMHGVHDVRIEDRPMPTPQPREVVVQLKAVGVCGSDMHYYEHGRIGPYICTAPLILGHEAAGIIVAAGSEVAKHRIGERVAIEPGLPCGRCRECRTGRYNLCKDVRFFATPPVDGAFCNFVAMHEDFVFTLPDNVSDEVGALLEPFSVGLWACQKGSVSAGSRVLVTGAGPIGLLACAAARSFGATQVAVADINPHRLAAAQRLGATRIIDVRRETPASVGLEFDVLIECSGNDTALCQAIEAIRPAGTVVVVGMGPADKVRLPLARIQNREIWLTGTFRYANTYPLAVELAAAGKVDLAAVITQRYPLDETTAALEVAHSDPTAIKPIVQPDA